SQRKGKAQSNVPQQFRHSCFYRLLYNAGIFCVRGHQDRAAHYGAHRSTFLWRPPCSRHQQAEWIKRKERLNLRYKSIACSVTGLSGLNGFHLDDFVPLEGGLKTVCKNDDHRRSVVPTTRCHHHFYLVVCTETGKANRRTHFTQPSSRSFGRRGYWNGHCPIGCGVDLSLLRPRFHCPNSSRSAHHSLVGKLFARSLAALSSYKKYGRRPRTYRTYERIKAGLDQY